jgi:transglutaminase/protease-like cytokinesis protein 3
MSVLLMDGVPAKAATSKQDSAILAVMEEAFENGDSQVVLTVNSNGISSQTALKQEAEGNVTELCTLLENAALSQGKVMTAFRYNYNVSSNSSQIIYKFDISDEYTQTVTKLSSEKKAYQQALKALKKRDYTSAFYSKNNKYYDTFVLCLEQHPEYNYGLTIWKSANGTCGYRASSALTESQIKSLMTKTSKKVSSIAKKIIKTNMSSTQKLQAIHDYLVKNCVYDEGVNTSGYDNAYTAYGCLIEKSAVCQGYTAAFNLLAAKAGITSINVSGVAKGGNHGWNMVKIGSSIKYVDVTWDDPLPDQGSKAKVRQTYFLVTQSVMAKDHTWNKKDFANKYLTYSAS